MIQHVTGKRVRLAHSAGLFTMLLVFAVSASAQTPPPDWTCPNSWYDDNAGCDCDCGAYDPDCDDSSQSLLRCPSEAVGCNVDGDCRVVPDTWTCTESWYDANDFCDCECGAYDPDCERDGLELSGCSSDAFGCQLDATCQTIPSEWSCLDQFYDADDGCDCNCGAYDPDCDDETQDLIGCPTGATGCTDSGECSFVPEDWTCNASWFAAGDGCDCECGAYDTDCDDASQALLRCPDNATGCSAEGTCELLPETWTCSGDLYDNNDGCHCDCGAYDPDCDSSTAELIGCDDNAVGCNSDGTCDITPAEWTCADAWYAAGDACDCDCGAYDPDCDTPDALLVGCDTGAYGCNPDGTCDYVPPDWTCQQTYFNASDGCDCDCGAYDPDCDDPTETLYGCPSGATGCDMNAQCILPAGPPAEWFCNPTTYDNNDGCDCNCGVRDPDCDDSSQSLFGCPQGSLGCDDVGICISPPSEPPAEWTCTASFYDREDGCDCDCGAYDPDCDLSGQTLYGCDQGALGCDSSGQCIEAPPEVPAEWSCFDEIYAAGDQCDCNCGAYDPDCDDPLLALTGCPSDAEGCSPEGECILPVCTPDCTGKECGGDGCGGFCGLCELNETCTEGICIPDADPIPASWMCDAFRYDAADGCDCDCGAYDPDCDLPGADLYGCPQDAVACDMNGACVFDDTPLTGWTCTPSYYDAQDGCDCSCGLYDPDCDIEGAELYGCDQSATGCDMNGECIDGAVPPPDTWVCPAVNYNNGDGCDCGCGAYDPDCDNPSADLFGCPQEATGCDTTGECILPCVPNCANAECGDDGCGGTCGTCDPGFTCESGQCEMSNGSLVPTDWSCPADNYDTKDGCHCGCGVLDPDCNEPNTILLGCNDGAIGCSPTGDCLYEGDICIPDCAGKECGSDGCDDVCGICAGTDYCSADGTCEPRTFQESDNDIDATRADESPAVQSGCNAHHTKPSAPPLGALFVLGALNLSLWRRRRS